MARTINYRSTVAVPGSERITFLLTLLLGSGKSRKWSRERRRRKDGWFMDFVESSNVVTIDPMICKYDGNRYKRINF